LHSFKIISIDKNNLRIEFDSVNSVKYIPFPSNQTKNLVVAAKELLANESWYYQNSQFVKDYLIEFKDSLEDHVIRPELTDKLSSADIHIFQEGYSDNHFSMA
jgi:hypothetical protein